MPTKRKNKKERAEKKVTKVTNRYTVKHSPASAAQVKAINEILAECQRLGASRRVMIATIMCATQESVIRPLNHGDGPGPDSRGYYQQREPWGPLSVRMSAAGGTRLFLTGGKGGQSGWKQKHGSVRNGKGDLAQMVTAVQVSVGGYGQWESEATKTVDTWLENPTSGGPGEGGEIKKRKSYAFKREKNESSWDAGTRLAEEVQWRLWSTNGKVHYASEPYLLNQRPIATITPTDPAVLDGFGFDVDSGSPANEVSFTVLADRWGLEPGKIIELEESGLANGRWIISSTSRSLFNQQVSIALTSARKPKKEPSPEIASRSVEGATEGGEGGSGVLAEAKRISDHGYPYAWGGGHPSAGSPSRGTESSKGGKIVRGYDCSGYVIACLVGGGFYTKGKPGIVSGDFGKLPGAKPGKGKDFTVWYNGNHVFIQFHKGAGKIKWADTSREAGGASGPHVRTGDRSTDGFQPCHFTAESKPKKTKKKKKED